MSFWNKLGKIALTAAPYVAAPFTGGLSLLGTGAANKAVQKWSEHDAKNAIAKGLAPSKFDSTLGKIGTIGSMASMFIPGGQLGMLGKAGDAVGKVGTAAANTGKLSNFVQGLTGGGSGLMGALGSTATNVGSNIGMSALDKIGSGSAQMPAAGTQTAQVPSEYTDVMAPFQTSLADSIFAGNQKARQRSAFA